MELCCVQLTETILGRRNISWKIFSNTIHLPTPKVRYAVGQSGSIIKPTETEENWKFIRNGRGFIVGKKGKIFSFETN